MTWAEYHSRLLHLQARAFVAGYRISDSFAMRTLISLVTQGAIERPNAPVATFVTSRPIRWSRR